ncbi:MAG: hypothetical protein WKF84_25650 [Pyrinomonadaceae bacterium]
MVSRARIRLWWLNNNRSNTGVIGVQRRVKRSVGKGGQVLTSEVFEVTWQAGREIKGKTSVSIKKYGESEAFQASLRDSQKERAADVWQCGRR